MEMCAETQYIYHSMLELGELTNEIPLMFELMEKSSSKKINLTEVFDLDEDRFKDNIELLTNEYYRTTSPIERSLIGYSFIMGAHNQLNSLVLNIKRQLKNIYLGKPSNMLMLTETPNKYSSIKSNVLSEIMLRKNQLMVLNESEDIISYLLNFKERYKKYTMGITHTLQESISYYYNINRVNTDELFNNLRTNYSGEDFFDRHSNKKVTKKEEKQLKRVLNKSIDILGSFIGRKNVSSFIGGEEFKIEGKIFNYKMVNTGNLLAKTKHIQNYAIQYDLLLFDKEWTYLSKLCVTFPGSPVLDQVLSVYLMIQAGQEKELLKASNFYSRSDELGLNDEVTRIKGFKDIETEASRKIRKVGKKTKKELLFESKNIILDKKIKSLIIKELNVPKIIGVEFFNQELTFDERVDYIGVGIEMPTHLDFLVDYGERLLS